METKKKRCPNNHELIAQKDMKFKCGSCDKEFDETHDRWACNECGFAL